MNTAAGREDTATLYRAFSRMQRLVLASDDRRRAVTEATGLSFSRTRALRRLARRPMRMTDLATNLGTDKPYATLIVDDLERRGLVTRTTDPDDRRCKLATVTEAGLALAVQADEILATPPRALASLTPADLETLEALLAKAEAFDTASDDTAAVQDQALDVMLSRVED